ncbi:DNA-binding SARP family transcriptional activator [Saccharothrix tamanrassetensis]|uniref:DNA-binding SARP family transcriptional activator n=1 Tax=Saccharothrix tamanrassetensis TaxID=1051531 RepID=A0A841CMS0_9PSEU|nr:BTAD domain-containing putative transcriptional regulator [Saccharothrix tamanrassetensis]MBB5958599.1 DNA-binding SARP family transcriptional activator [Saccharothrix tamanrassetensis]
MRFRVLGPVQIRDGEEWATVRARQQRCLLALLLIEEGRTVTADRLADELWSGRPPKSALNTIHVYVTRLRRLIGEDAHDVLVTTTGGYRLAVDYTDVDARVFLDLVQAGQRELAEGKPEAAAQTLGAALALWHGPAFGDVEGDAPAAEAARLDHVRLTALEARLDADLRLGRHAQVVDELQGWVALHPLREQLLGHLVLALYRCGRRAEALDAYRRGRAHLIAELGLEPGPALRDLEHAVLSDDPVLALARDTARLPLVEPAQLPADAAGFTGRDVELRELDRLLTDVGNPPTALPVSVITGTAGVGKTALALHWAHRVRGKFGGGQLFADLRGHAAGPPAEPIAVLTRFLRALGVRAEEIPADVDEAAALYRSVLADRMMLVVLDDARDQAQVRPLLPGSDNCVVLVTSRTPLSGLVAGVGARSLPLDVLTGPEAEALLRTVLGPDRTGPVPDLARLCARLPLALRIAAAYLSARPALSISRYVGQLRGDRLAALRAPDEVQSAVRAAFDRSYRRLGDDARRLFRLLGAVPAVDFTVQAAAALIGVTDVDADCLVAELATAHLLDEHRPGRYRSHDLLRAYARELADGEDDTDAATDRLNAWYLLTVDQAATALYPQMLRLTLPPANTKAVRSTFEGHADASAWLDEERSNLLAAVTHAARYRPVATVGLIADALRGYFWLRMNTMDWLATAEAASDIAEALDDTRGSVVASLSLADVHFRQGHNERAERHSTDALTSAARSAWIEGQAAAHGNLGNLALESGCLPEALEHHSAALALNRRTGRLTSQANNLGNLGLVHWHRGDLRQAQGLFTDALEISKRVGSAHGRAVGLTNLACVQHDLGDLDRSIRHLVTALGLHQETGDRSSEAEARAELATVYTDTGFYDEAFEQAHLARALARDARDRRREVDSLIAFGATHDLLRHCTEATAYYLDAVDLARDIAYRFGEAKALIGLAATRRDADDAHTALVLTRRHTYRLLEGHALLALATIDTDSTRAAEHTSRANTRFAEIGHRVGAARARLMLAGLRGGDRHHRP